MTPKMRFSAQAKVTSQCNHFWNGFAGFLAAIRLAARGLCFAVQESRNRLRQFVLLPERLRDSVGQFRQNNSDRLSDFEAFFVSVIVQTFTQSGVQQSQRIMLPVN